MRKKCLLCKKRYVEQQDWKTSEEKDYCLTCLTLKETIKGVLDALKQIAKNKGIRLDIDAKLTPGA